MRQAASRVEFAPHCWPYISHLDAHDHKAYVKNAKTPRNTCSFLQDRARRCGGGGSSKKMGATARDPTILMYDDSQISG